MQSSLFLETPTSVCDFTISLCLPPLVESFAFNLRVRNAIHRAHVKEMRNANGRKSRHCSRRRSRTCSCAEYEHAVKRYNVTRRDVHRSVSEECKRIPRVLNDPFRSELPFMPYSELRA